MSWQRHANAQDSDAATAAALRFFKWAFAKGDKTAEELDYIPMPEPFVQLIEKTWSADIKS